MKVVTPKEMAHIEKLAYSEGFQEELFMENAGKGVAHALERFRNEHALEKSALLLVAKGGNSGDAFVAGRYLLQLGWIVTAFEAVKESDMAELTKKNRSRFQEVGGRFLEAPDFHVGLILDGLFGTGFRGTIEEPYLSLVRAANQSRTPIVSIDIPSGVHGGTGEVSSVAISATKTLFLGLPKVGLFLGEGWEHVGDLEGVEFGLIGRYTSQANSDFTLIEESAAASFLPSLRRRQHKYSKGCVTALAGSLAMPGAAALALLGALRGGAGIAKLMVKEEEMLLPLPNELLRVPYHSADEALAEIQKGKAALIGPGLGRSKERFSLLWHLLPRLSLPTVLDGDALFFLAEENPTVPHSAILTPHRGEMERLLHQPIENELSFLKACKEYAETKNVTLILKGSPTFIFHPGEKTLISTFGSPGMATAGSGDLLSGIVAAQLARGLPPREAALFGVVLHGLAGELAAIRRSPYSVIASDILDAMGDAFWYLEEVN